MAKKQKKHYLSWVCRKIRRRIPMILCLTVLNALIAYASVQFALTTKSAVNNAIARDPDGLRLSVILMIALCLFRIFGSTLSQILTTNVTELLERDFKHDMLSKILRSEYSQISRYHSGDLIQRMEQDAGGIFHGILTFTSGLAAQITSLVTAVIALLQIAPGFTLIFGSAATLLGGTTLLFRNVLKRLSKESSAANGAIKGFLHESISKLMVIQALDVSAELEQRCERILDERWTIRKKQLHVSIISRLGITILTYSSYLITMLWCAYKLFRGEITYGDMTAMTSLVSTVRSGSISFPRLLPQLIAISACCDRIMEIEDLADQPDPDAAAVRALYPDMTGFTAEHLTFAYDRDPVMRDVSLTIPKGGLTVIIGPSGIGKSTLLKLLLGLYRPASGSLVINTPAGPVTVDRATRSLFSYAPQGNFLLSGTLRENLTFTNPDATEEEIRDALYASAMDEYVATLPLGLETVLMENGAGLSEGQAQRLSLARAIISGAPVLLLDEVTSALDAVTEATVLERITALPGKTCIAVTHRPAALELASHVIEVTEEGMTITAR